MTNESFSQFLDWASAKVSKWPKWKREVLGKPKCEQETIVGDTSTAMALALVLAERWRQIDKGFDKEHDQTHTDGELINAARAMLVRALPFDVDRDFEAAKIFPWKTPEGFAQMPTRKTEMRDLIIAAAFVLAEIERRLDSEG